MSECGSPLAFLESMAPPSIVLASRAETSERNIVTLMNRINCGAAIVQRDGEVMAINPLARKLVGDGLLLTQQRLSVASRHYQDQFDDLLGKAFGRGLSGDACLCIPSLNGQRPLLLRFIPLDENDFAENRSGSLKAGELDPLQRQGLRPELLAREVLTKAAAVLLLIFDLEIRSSPSCAPALRALGLTPAEATVALLVGAGLSPLDASDRLGITVLTVRTHLKAIFQKLNLQRQGELVRLVSHLGMLS